MHLWTWELVSTLKCSRVPGTNFILSAFASGFHYNGSAVTACIEGYPHFTASGGLPPLLSCSSGPCAVSWGESCYYLWGWKLVWFHCLSQLLAYYSVFTFSLTESVRGKCWNLITDMADNTEHLFERRNKRGEIRNIHRLHLSHGIPSSYLNKDTSAMFGCIHTHKQFCTLGFIF